MIASDAGATAARTAPGRAARQGSVATGTGNAAPIAGARVRAAQDALACGASLTGDRAGPTATCHAAATAVGPRAQQRANAGSGARDGCTGSGSATDHLATLGVVTAHSAETGVLARAIERARARRAAGDLLCTAPVYFTVHQAIEAGGAAGHRSVRQRIDFTQLTSAAVGASSWARSRVRGTALPRRARARGRRFSARAWARVRDVAARGGEIAIVTDGVGVRGTPRVPNASGKQDERAPNTRSQKFEEGAHVAYMYPNASGRQPLARKKAISFRERRR